MAGGAGRMTRVYVVETSYLCELYGVPNFSDPKFSRRYGRGGTANRRRVRASGFPWDAFTSSAITSLTCRTEEEGGNWRCGSPPM